MRIRYQKGNLPNTFKSVKSYSHPTSGARYRIELDCNSNKWMILDDVSGLEAASGLRIHKHKMKIDVREALKLLGVVLPIDERAKRPKV